MSYTKLDIKELQNRLDAIAISEDADGKDIIVNKDIKLAGDSRYGKGKNPESVFVTKVEILPRGDEDGVAMADVFVEHDGPMEIYTDSGFEAEISKIVGFNVDFTESGMQQPGRASLEGLSQVSEYSITTRDEREFNQEDFNLAHAVDTLAQKLVAKAGKTNDGMYDPQKEYYDASDYYGYPDVEELLMPEYGDLKDYDKEKFMANYVEPPVVNPDAIGESVEEGEAELAELKSALGRTGGVMGFKN